MSEPAPEGIAWNFLRGAMMTKALGVVSDLAIAERLGGDALTADELASETGVDPDSLHRILRALASDGVFAQVEGGAFRNTEVSQLLCRPDWAAFGHHFGSVFYDAVSDLGQAARTGAATFPERFGDDFWPWLGARPEERRLFDEAMAGERGRSADRLAELWWRGDETVVDVGGGNGALLVELVRRRPRLRGIVLDLPETHRDESGLGDAIEFVAGSFFEAVPPGDAYVLSGVLHDWDDERATTILRTIGVSAPRGARVLILESVIAAGNESEGAKWLDLLMLVLSGGRERTEPEWRALIEGARLRVESIESGLIQASCP